MDDQAAAVVVRKKCEFYVCILLLICYMSCMVGVVSSESTPSLEDKCGTEIPKLMGCLDYSTGKAAKPTDACCTSVADMRKTDSTCLCFFIQQASHGAPTIKQLGVKVDRLLQLPSVCQLANSSVSDCPKLLNLSPTSPDNAIFTNVSTAGKTSPASNTTSMNDKGGVPMTEIGSITLLSMIFLSVLSTISP